MQSLFNYFSDHKILLELITSTATLLTAIFAYLAARNSRITNFNTYLPILDIEEMSIFTQENKVYFRIKIDNESENTVAHAKNVYLFIPEAGIKLNLYMINPANLSYSRGEMIDLIVNE